MKGQELLRTRIVRLPPDLIVSIYERERVQQGPTRPEIVRGAEELRIFTVRE